jgi:hypothetical protein
MKYRRLFLLCAPMITLLFLLIVGYPTSVATAQTIYGTLDNFDVINDTGGETHGFEIELEGISASDVAYTFGAPYQRYGDPTVVVNATKTGVIIRYAASYSSGTWSAATPIAVAPFPPTQGHSCWTGGDPNYLSSGCDHFGASLNATPTKTTYRWLVASTTTPGTLTPFGSNVPIPAPVWNVTPPAVPGNQPIAAAVIAPPAPVPPAKWGEPLWAKVYVSELPIALQADDLDHLVIDDPNYDFVPNEQIEPPEIEWVLLQSGPSGNGEQEFGGGAEVVAGNEAVSRRFEFYKYTGQIDLDPDNYGEALCDNPTALDQQLPASPRCGAPDSNGVAGVGDLIGAQNVAINLAGPVVVIPENHPPVISGSKPATVNMSEDGSPTAFSLTLNATDRDADILQWSITTPAAHGAASASGAGLSKAIGYTPSANYNGNDSFVVQVSDGMGGADTITVNVNIAAVNDAPIANAGASQTVRMRDVVTLNGSGSDVDGNPLTYSWSLITVPAHSKAVLSAVTSASPTFTADKAGTYVARLVANDGTVNSAAATVTITATKGKK